MEKYDCIIIDDEPFAINWMKEYIESVPHLRLLKFYTNPLDALLEIQRLNMVDLIILDIDMPQINGLELSLDIRQKTRKLIFSTAFKQYGYEAFEAQADAYLLKPYTFSKFAGTIAKLLPAIPEINDEPGKADDFFFVKNKNEQLKIVKIRYSEVVAVESKQNYVLIHTLSKQVLTYISLTEISRKLLPMGNFVQFQRSFIIGKDHIDSIDGNTIKMITGLKITVGELYRKDFSNFLSNKILKAGTKS